MIMSGHISHALNLIMSFSNSHALNLIMSGSHHMLIFGSGHICLKEVTRLTWKHPSFFVPRTVQPL